MERIKNWHETVEILETLRLIWLIREPKLSQLSQVSHCKKYFVYCRRMISDKSLVILSYS